MKTTSLVVLATVASASAFSSSSFNGARMNNVANQGSSLTMEYIPSGMSKAQWEKIKNKEKAKTAGKDLGKVGITSFKSRSFAEWQKAGGKNLFPVDPKTVKDPKDLPYMQRKGGAADDSDIGSAKKGGGFFSFGKKKAPEPEPEPEPEKKKNWWTL